LPKIPKMEIKQKYRCPETRHLKVFNLSVSDLPSRCSRGENGAKMANFVIL